MNIRTLSKEDTIHLVNLSCMVLAWGVSCFYFDASASNSAVATLGDRLLAPFHFVERFSQHFLYLNISHNPIAVFAILWITYFILGMRLSKFLLVKNHETSELKSWYFARKSH